MPQEKLLEPRPEIGQASLAAADYKMLFVEHTPENAEPIADSLRDCDVIAFELGGFESEEDRAEWATLYSDFIASSFSATSQENQKMISDRVTSVNPFEAIILSKLKGTDKQVALVDVNKGDPSFENAEIREIDAKLWSAWNMHAPIAELRELTGAMIALGAESGVGREETIVRQLQDLPNKVGMEHPRIGVVLGAGHTSVRRSLRKSGAQVESEFIAPHLEPNDDSTVKVHYPYMIQAMRHVTIGGQDEVPPGLIDRKLLDNIYLWTNAYQPPDDDPEGSARNFPEQRNIIDRMSDEEVAQLLEAIDGTRLPEQPQYGGRPVTGELTKLLTDNQARYMTQDAWSQSSKT